MKERYRLFLRRKSVYYAFDNTTKTFQSLKTNLRRGTVATNIFLRRMQTFALEMDCEREQDN